MTKNDLITIMSENSDLTSRGLQDPNYEDYNVDRAFLLRVSMLYCLAVNG